MDTNAITTLISNLGFPIVLVLGCMYFMYKIKERNDSK